MPAPIGNQFWKLAVKKPGAPMIFKAPEEVLAKAKEYIDWCNNNPWIKKDFIKSGERAGEIIELTTQRPYTIEGFCLYCGITFQTFLNYERDESHKEFFEVFTYVRNIIDNQHLEGGYVGAFNPMLVARKLKLKEQTETTGNVNHSVTQINFVQRSVEDTTYQDVSEAIEEDL